MLKCTMCGKVEKCCHILCPVCGERMVRMEDKEPNVEGADPEEAIGSPLFPEALRTQCKVCGQRTHLYLVTDYRVGGALTLGICRDCYFSKDRSG